MSTTFSAFASFPLLKVTFPDDSCLAKVITSALEEGFFPLS